MADFETFKSDVRDAVLEALDEVAKRHFPDKGLVLGANDAELPRLFPALDAHAEVAFNRLSD